MDGEPLLLDAATGVLEGGALSGMEFGQCLGKFRNELVAGKLEWAEGSWVEVSA